MDLTLHRRRLGQVGRWMAACLLLAQFGAQLHLYSHPLAYPADRIGSVLSCGTCLASSQLQHAVAAPVPVAPTRTIAWVTVVPEAALPAARIATFRAFQARAPPVPA